MNKLKPDKQEAVIRALVKDPSIRSPERMGGMYRDTMPGPRRGASGAGPGG